MNNLGEKTLANFTLVFLMTWVPAIGLFLLKDFARIPHPDAFGWVSTGAMAAWPVVHFLGYYQRNKPCAVTAAILHCIFAGLVFFIGFRMSLKFTLCSLVYGGWHLLIGYLMVRLRVTRRTAAVHSYFLILLLTIAWLRCMIPHSFR